METFRDYDGRLIRFTDERREHILEHPGMVTLIPEIPETLARPERVVRSRSDADVRLYYRSYTGTVFGSKCLCVVVKAVPDDAFVITSYVTDSIKQGNSYGPEIRDRLVRC